MISTFTSPQQWFPASPKEKGKSTEDPGILPVRYDSPLCQNKPGCAWRPPPCQQKSDADIKFQRNNNLGGGLRDGLELGDATAINEGSSG